MPLDDDEIEELTPDIYEALQQVWAFADENSAGGRRITRGEWRRIQKILRPIIRRAVIEALD